MSARSIVPYLPSLAIVAVSLAAWFWLRADAAKARAKIGARPVPEAVAGAGPSALPDDAEKLAALRRDLAGLKSRIESEGAALVELRATNAELESQIPLESDEMVASFGRVADMGKEIGTTMRAIAPIFTGAAAQIDDPEDEERASMGFFKIMAWASDIGDMEVNPDEISTLQSEAIGGLFRFEDNEIAALRPILKEGYRTLSSGGFAMPDRPAEDDDDGEVRWKKGRSDALKRMMLELKPSLPDSISDAEGKALATLLNIGVGMVQREESVVLVPWPDVPW